MFAFVGLSYPAWYLANGALLSFAVPILSAVGVDLDRRYGLISAHPMYFLSAVAVVATDWSNIWDPTGSSPRYLQGTRSVAFDRLISAVLGKLLGVALVAWFLVTGPARYLLNLVGGAPARAALASGRVVWDHQTLAFEKDADGSVVTNNWSSSTAVLRDSDPKPHEAARRLGFDVKPVSVTYALSGLLLFAVLAIVERTW